MGLVLASASPRRQELLKALVADFSVYSPDIEEELRADPVVDAERLSAEKAAAALERVRGELVLAADTIVHDGTRPFGKPRDDADAFEILRQLRGREHRVVTGVSLASEAGIVTAHSEALVRLSDLTDAQIESYIASGRPMDKAGAYAIQDDDVPTVASLEGCYCCVMGLPLWLVRDLLTRHGVFARRPDRTFERCAQCPERPRSADA